jgi:hypothetical protein
MAALTDRIANVSGSLLEPGEVITVATNCVPAGDVSRRAFSFGLAGALGGTLLTKLSTPAEHAMGGEALPRDLALALTDRRILVVALGAMRGRPTTVARSIRLDLISGVSFESHRVLLTKVGRFGLLFFDGSRLDLETSVKSATPFVAALRRVTTHRETTKPDITEVSND